MVELKEYQRRQKLKVKLLNHIAKKVNRDGSIVVCFDDLHIIFGISNDINKIKTYQISDNIEILKFLEKYNFEADVDLSCGSLHLFKKQNNINDKNMSKEELTFNFLRFDLDRYNKEENAAEFIILDNNGNVETQFLNLKDIELQLETHQNCKQLKKALKLYKLLDKYVK